MKNLVKLWLWYSVELRFLVYSAKAKIPQNELLFELKKHLATYMVPTVIEYRETLPLKASHHEVVDKAVLKKEF